MATFGEIKTIFDKLDKDEAGKISTNKLRDVFQAFSPSATPEELDKMVKLVDSDGDGYVDFEEFVSFLRNSSDADDIKGAFDMYDLDGDGKISSEELHVVLERLGEKCTVEDCVRMIGKVDADGDGHVDLEEFKTMMKKRL